MIGQVLGGKYALERLIGRGGMGHVYLAANTEDANKQVVVKMIAPPLAQQPQAMARFEREAKRLDGLRHSNVVEMYDYGHAEGRAYIVMEHVDGELLSDYMARKGRLTLAEFVPIAAQILKGVGHAHSRDLMIRDIKPANVMLCERKGRANFVKIIDFGLAKMLEGDEDITKQHFIGTSGYLSPEQIKGQDIDLRVDVYALGVLFYQMLSGRMPFEAENDTTLLYKHVHEFPTPLSEVLPDDHEVPDELVHLIHDCLEKDPEQRPRDANEIVERLIDCVPMSMFKLPPVGHDAAPTTAGDTGAVSALSTAALAAPTGETAAYLEVQAEEANAAALSAAGRSTGNKVVIAEPPPSKGKLGLIVGAVAAVVVVGILAVVMTSGGEGEDEQAQAQGASAAGDLEGSLAAAEKLAADGDYEAASRALAEIRGQLAADTALSGRGELLQETITLGKLIAAARGFDEEGKTAAAISAYEDVLEAEPANVEARERLAELRNAGKETATVGISSDPVASLSIDGKPAGTTPYEEALPLGKHEIELSADGYEDWKQEVEIKAEDNLPIKVKLSALAKEPEEPEAPKKKSVSSSSKPAATKPATKPSEPASAATEKPTESKSKSGNNPFLPTKKPKKDGPFLPAGK
ncbi:serine/threonine-protein kinase [Pseudenhygromyxa sp. WMMC2535]|uniref:serine/threonine-protein kinase n=1 Tax=Pseudenhygromyxa sp. WMMC2535 TaxID=2712867 RepID=UPI0015573499|nr:serine/threonine-protein kinase [Pseudenhygromyxa sp. WMMC2535]